MSPGEREARPLVAFPEGINKRMRYLFRSPELAKLATIAARYSVKMDGAPAPAPPAPAPAPTPTPAPTPAPPKYIDADVERIVRKYGSPERAIKRLFRDAHHAREGKREAEQQRDGLKAQLDGQTGGMVLTPEQKKQWDAYQQLGKKPDELTAILSQHGELAGRVAKQELEETARAAAKLLQWNPDAAVKMIAKEKLKVVVKKEKNSDNVEVEVPYVQPGGEGASPIKLEEFVKGDEYALYLPALAIAGEVGSPGGATDSARSTPWMQQTPSSRALDGGAGGGTNKSAPPIRDKPVLPSQRKA